MLFDIFNIFPYYLHVNYWTGKSVRIFSRKQVISGNFRRYDVYSWVCYNFHKTLYSSKEIEDFNLKEEFRNFSIKVLSDEEKYIPWDTNYL